MHFIGKEVVFSVGNGEQVDEKNDLWSRGVTGRGRRAQRRRNEGFSEYGWD